MKTAILIFILALLACGGISTIPPTDPDQLQEDEDHEQEKDAEKESEKK